MNEDCERIRAALVGACCNEDGLDSCDGQHAIYALDRVEQSLAAARREVETVTQRAIRAEADLATSRAALEDVLWQEAHPNVEVVSRRRAEDDEKLWVAYDRSGNVNDTEWFAIAEGDTWKEALRNARRALAQEAGDAK